MMDRPDTLTGEAAEFWDRLVDTCEREEIRVSHRWDLLYRYAETWSLWRECVDGIHDEGQIVQAIGPDGTRDSRRNPRMVDYGQLSRLLAQCAAELGLSARARLELEAGVEMEPEPEAERKIVYKIRG